MMMVLFKVSQYVLKISHHVLEELTATIFRVTECSSGGCWSN